MKLKYFKLTILFLCYLGSNAQNTGFMGKHFIAKTDIVYLIGSSYDIQAEFAFHRGWSGTFNYTHQNVPASEKSISQITTQAHEFKFGLRHYLTPEQASPSGGYHFINLGYGTFNSSGLSIDSTFYSDGILIYQSKNRYEVRNIPVYRADVGIGYQQIYFGFLSLDLSVGFGFCYTTSDNIQEYSVARSYRSVGNQWRWQSSDTRFNYGMRFLVQAGLLLF